METNIDSHSISKEKKREDFFVCLVKTPFPGSDERKKTNLDGKEEKSRKSLFQKILHQKRFEQKKWQEI